jgi:hypothetical protein
MDILNIETSLKEYINLCKQYDKLKMKDLLYKILNKNNTLNYNNSTIQLLQNLIPHFTVIGLLNIQDHYYLFKSGGKNKSISYKAKSPNKYKFPKYSSPKSASSKQSKSPKSASSKQSKSPKSKSPKSASSKQSKSPKSKSPKSGLSKQSKSSKNKQRLQQSRETDNYKDIKNHAKQHATDISKKLISHIANNISSKIPDKQSQYNQKLIQEIIKVLEPNLAEPIPNLEELIKEAVINATS